VAVCEATDDHGGIAAHRNIAKDNAMVGMMLNAEITAPSLAIFVRGTHEVGTFVELLTQHQRETENKSEKNRFWILHGCIIFRLAYGRVTSGEMVDPTSGTRTEMLSTMSPNMDAAVKPHPAPIASTFWTILKIVFLKLMAYVVLCLSRQPAQTITTFIVLA